MRGRIGLFDLVVPVEAMGLEPTNLLTASQALYQLSYAPSGGGQASSRRWGPRFGPRDHPSARSRMAPRPR